MSASEGKKCKNFINIRLDETSLFKLFHKNVALKKII